MALKLTILYMTINVERWQTELTFHRFLYKSEYAVKQLKTQVLHICSADHVLSLKSAFQGLHYWAQMLM